MNNQPPELSPEARRLINEARRADDPTAEDHARVKARWLASVAAVAGVSSLTEAARAAGSVGWGFKAIGAALVIAAGAIGVNFALDTDGSAVSEEAVSEEALSEQALSEQAVAKPATARPGSSNSSPERLHQMPGPQAASENAAPKPLTAEPAPGVQAVPVAAEAAQPPSPQVAEVEEPSKASSSASVPAEGAAQPQAIAQARSGGRERPVARAVVARTSTPRAPAKGKEGAGAAPAPVDEAPAAVGPSGQLSDELALLSDVRSSIQEGAGARALELLDRYESRFGQPILGMEADALRVDALCKAGQRDAARESARAFQNEWPGSPLERRVSAACP